MANKNKEKKNTNVVRNILFIIIAVIIIAAIAIIFFKGSFGKSEKETQAGLDSPSVTVNANISNNSNITDDSTSDTTIGGTESTSEQSSSTSITPSKSYSLPLNVNEALDMLSEHYGNRYEVNSTVAEGEYNYFAVIKDGEKYASVKVNLSNGDATETISETGKTSNFNLI